MKPLNEINKKNNYAIVDISNKITTYVASCKAEMKPETSSAPTPKPIITKPVTAKFKVLQNNQISGLSFSEKFQL
jgi:molybdenum cofactor biosynthesis enzyme